MDRESDRPRFVTAWLTPGLWHEFLGNPLTTSSDCTVNGVASEEKDCGMRYECNYIYNGVPTETELLIKTSGDAWAALYDYNIYIPNSEVKNGVYAVSFGGGQVDITNGKFVFSASEAYLIEDGKITRPVKGATLVGSGPDILKQVSMVGHDLKLDEGIGTCGKEGQSVPVGVGLPTIRIDEITVGGTKA